MGQLDPDARALLADRKRADIAATDAAVDDVRASRAAWREAQAVQTIPVGAVRDHRIDVGGAEIAARVYRMSEAAGPAIVYFHGGGWVLGDLDHSDALCRRLCADTGFTVVNVDYRLAPEHRFPVAANDCHAAFLWTVDNAAGLGIDPSRIAVAGSSAGGNLAAAVTLMTRAAGGTGPAAQVLVYPALDDGCTLPSFSDYAEGYLVSARDMKWYWRQYLGPDGDAASPLACPLKASDLSGLQPALIITAECDPIRDDGERYASRLRSAGNSVRSTRYDGVLHGFFAMPGVIGKADNALAEAGDFLRETLAGGGKA